MRSKALFQVYDDTHRGAAIGALKDIIEVCRDGEQGYAVAARDVQDSWLVQLFWSYSNQRARFAVALEYELQKLGAQADSKQTMAGWIHRKWLEVRTSLDHGAAIGVLLECERGENAARAKYEKALSIPLPQRVQEVLLDQLAEIRAAHDRFDHMRGGSISFTSLPE